MSGFEIVMICLVLVGALFFIAGVCSHVTSLSLIGVFVGGVGLFCVVGVLVDPGITGPPKGPGVAEVSVAQANSLISGGSVRTAYFGGGDLFLQTTGGRWDALALIDGQAASFLGSLQIAHVTVYTSDTRVPASVTYGAP